MRVSDYAQVWRLVWPGKEKHFQIVSIIKYCWLGFHTIEATVTRAFCNKPRVKRELQSSINDEISSQAKPQTQTIP